MRIRQPDDSAIREAAAALARGEAVGMPTETVYGIATIATDEDGVRRVFEIKGRPSDNPLIVHVASIEQAQSLAAEWPETADSLARHFWPGPLTLVLSKSAEVPDIVTAGLSTVAIRMPDHSVALWLIHEAGRPLAAPSANRFTELSPTRAEDISPEITRNLALVIDGGPCEFGLESTVVDVTGGRQRILRPGAITREQIEHVAGPVADSPVAERRSPGMYVRHYSPKAKLRIVTCLAPEQSGLTFGRSLHENQVHMPSDPAEYGKRLYAALHRLDRSGVQEVGVEAPPEDPAWDAIWDRLRKASYEGD